MGRTAEPGAPSGPRYLVRLAHSRKITPAVNDELRRFVDVIDSGRSDGVEEWAKPRAERGDADGEFLMGYLVFGPTRMDLRQSCEWLRRAAAQDHPEALFSSHRSTNRRIVRILGRPEPTRCAPGSSERPTSAALMLRPRWRGSWRLVAAASPKTNAKLGLGTSRPPRAGASKHRATSDQCCCAGKEVQHPSPMALPG